VTESWLDSEIDSSFLSVPNYFAIRKDRNSLGGGISVLCSTSFDIIQCKCVTYDVLCKSDILSFCIKPNILVIVIYHPYWGVSVFHDIVVDHIVNIVLHGQAVHDIKSVLICGDFNGLSQRVDTLNSLLNTESLFTFNTRGDAQLDFVLSNSKTFYSESYFLPPLGKSDHLVIVCPSTRLPSPPSIMKSKIRNICPSTLARFHIEISNSRFLNDMVLHVDDVSLAANRLSSYLFYLFDKHFPLRSIKLRSDDKPWIKPSLKLLINKRDRAFSQGKRLKYLRLRKSVIILIRKLKSDFLACHATPKNSKLHWASINKLLGRSTRRLIDIDVQQLADHFSTLFSTPNDDQTFSLDSLPSRSFEFHLSDVIRILSSLKKGSPGPDSLPFWIFRDYYHILAPSILHICQLSINSCLVPQCFKIASISLIPKSQAIIVRSLFFP
jgi:hypothetical protein